MVGRMLSAPVSACQCAGPLRPSPAPRLLSRPGPPPPPPPPGRSHRQSHRPAAPLPCERDVSWHTCSEKTGCAGQGPHQTGHDPQDDMTFWKLNLCNQRRFETRRANNKNATKKTLQYATGGYPKIPVTIHACWFRLAGSCNTVT